MARPVTFGFSKLFSLVFAPERRPQAARQNCCRQNIFGPVAQLDVPECLGPGQESHHFLDCYALTRYKSIERAVDEILQDKGSLLSKDGQAKVQFWFTDVLRLAHVNLCICQFCAAQHGASQEAARTQPNVYEFILAPSIQTVPAKRKDIVENAVAEPVAHTPAGANLVSLIKLNSDAS